VCRRRGHRDAILAATLPSRIDNYSDDWRVVDESVTFEGRGFSEINPAAKPNTYTGKAGSKRD